MRLHARRFPAPAATVAALLFLAAPLASSARGAGTAEGRAAMVSSIEALSEDYWEAARQIWEWAEPGYQETRSSALLAELLEKHGFRVERGVAEIPTAFVAESGAGAPVLGILAEFDALPGLSQEAVPEKRPRRGSSWGHGCGHHLFGVASVAAAIAVADALERGELRGTLRLYGTPAEEGGAAKLFMVRAGLFSDVDAVLHWHPNDENTAGSGSNLARVAAKFRFRGKSAHAAAAPEQGRSALDAVELTNHAAQLLREHTPDRTRIHHVITAGGQAPNVVPDFAEVYYYVRHPDPAVTRSVFARLLKCAEAGALATETELEVEHLGGVHNLLPNETLSGLVLGTLRELNDLSYTPEEADWAERLQQTLPEPLPLASLRQVRDTAGEISTGSTDVGDVSWVVPTAGFGTACWVPGTAAHSWQATAAGGTSIGRKGMMLAARVLAASAWDLLAQPSLLEEARKELAQRLAGKPYEAMIEPDQPPPLDYRNPPRSER